MRELPSGTVTFLFTDVESSTRLLHELGAASYAGVLQEHRRLLRDCMARHSGVEVDTQGDAFFVAFATASGAVAAARDAQIELASGPISVRMGLHTGSPHLTEEGYVGEEVHLGARIVAAGHGGQVLLSQATRELVEAELVDLGEHRLKDFEQAVSIFQLGGDQFPPLRTISNTNLPSPASSFVGREREVGDVVSLIREGARLVTLSGPGGSGKTRLAIEAASALVPEFKAGAFWVGLAPLRDPALVMDVIAQTLGAQDGLAAHVAGRELLLLLDNFEQVVEAAAELSALLLACPNLTLLVTSRELLRIQGEVDFPVPALAEAEAVELFRSRSGLGPSDEIAELCRRLDNLPLAVELAAARTSVLSPAQILERLSHRLDLLKGGRDVDPRQRTLRTTIEWSHDLLIDEEKRLFARMSVFVGGCTLEAAEEIAGADIDMLQSLVDKSFVRHTAERFWMLETIREYGLESLAALADGKEVQAAHAAYFLSLAERAEPMLRSPEGPDWLDVLEAERDNLRAALDWFRAQDQAEHELRLATSLGDFWLRRGPIAEAQRWLQQAIGRAGAALPERRADALHAASYHAYKMGDYETAEALGRELLDLARTLGDPLREVTAVSSLAHVAESRDRLEEARALYEDAVATSRDAGNPRLLATSLLNLADLALVEGDYERAAELCRESLVVAEPVGDPGVSSSALHNLGYAQLKLGDLAAAAASMGKAIELALTERNDDFLSMELIVLAAVLKAAGSASAAARLLGLADELAEGVGGVLEPAERQLRAETEVEVKAVLGDTAFDTAHAAGRRLTVADALVIARDLD